MGENYLLYVITYLFFVFQENTKQINTISTPLGTYRDCCIYPTFDNKFDNNKIIITQVDTIDHSIINNYLIQI